MTPLMGNTFLFHSSQQLGLGPLEDFFELTRRPLRALYLPFVLLPELQRNKDTFCCFAAWRGGPRNNNFHIVHLLT